MTGQPIIEPLIRASFAVNSEQRRAITIHRHNIFCKPSGNGGQQIIQCRAQRAEDCWDDYDETFPMLFQAKLNDDLMIASSRLLILGGAVSQLPTGKLLKRLKDAPEIEEGYWYCEPSRVCIIKSFRGTDLGHEALLRMIGAQIEVALQTGFDRYLMSLRYPMIRSRALRWFPWNLSRPINYPSNEGGSMIDEPIWPAWMDLIEVIELARTIPAAYMTMFPNGTDHLDLSLFDSHERQAKRVRPRITRSAPELAAFAEATQQKVVQTMVDWQNGTYVLDQLGPDPASPSELG